jgi:transcriptional regulator with XRE-family HTH domain
MTEVSKMTIDQQIGRRLRDLRQSMGDRQADFAARIWKERSTVAKYERGERKLSLTDIIDIAERLNYPPVFLLLKLLPESRSDPNIDALLAAIVQRPGILPTVLRSTQEALQPQLGN